MRKWEPPLKGGEAAEPGYTTSEDEDELTRLKPAANSGTSTSGGSSSGGHHHQLHQQQGQQQSHKGGGGHRGRNNYLHSQSEATSPGNDSDNTYAEALLLQNPQHQQQPLMQRYGQCL